MWLLPGTVNLKLHQDLFKINLTLDMWHFITVPRTNVRGNRPRCVTQWERVLIEGTRLIREKASCLAFFRRNGAIKNW